MEQDWGSALAAVKFCQEQMRVQVLETLSHKGDLTLLDRIREQILQKVDLEYINNLMQKMKNDLEMFVDCVIGESSFSKKLNGIEC